MDVPLPLLRYRAEEWPAGPQAWYDAREEYAVRSGARERDHVLPTDLPDPVDGYWPDVPYNPTVDGV